MQGGWPRTRPANANPETLGVENLAEEAMEKGVRPCWERR
jgi:hypothetical protein